MHVLLTGGGGFSGSYLVRALLGAGHRVTAVAGRSRGRLDADAPGLTVLTGDLAADLALPRDVEVVVHAAASSPAPGVTVGAMARSNVAATARLIGHARQTGAAKFIFLSSLSVYGRIAEPVVREETPITDPDAYGVTKRLGELMLAEESARLPSLSLRLPSVVGTGSVRNWPTVVLAAAKAGREIAYYNPDAPYNNLVHVDDLCRFVVALCDRKWSGHECVNLASAGQMSVREAVEAIVAGAGGRAPLRLVRGAKASFTVSIERATARFGFAPRHVREALARFVQDNA